MKGTIAVCLEELVRNKFGRKQWNAICAEAGLPRNHRFSLTNDVPDGDVVGLIGVTAQVLGISEEQAKHAFGVYWSTEYAPKVYAHFFSKADSARDFLLQLDDIHDVVTRTMDSARPPRFTYDEGDTSKLVMHYSSPRGLVSLLPGLAEGIGIHYGEKVSVHVSGEAVTVRFEGKLEKAA